MSISMGLIGRGRDFCRIRLGRGSIIEFGFGFVWHLRWDFWDFRDMHLGEFSSFGVGVGIVLGFDCFCSCWFEKRAG